MKCVELLLLLLSTLIVCQANVLSNFSLGIDAADSVINPCKDVRLAGFVCVNCGTLGYCSYVNGEWQTVQMSTCQTERGFYCSDENTFGCTWQPSCTVPVRGKFYCQGAGIYPDPYDCRSYHECSAQNVDTPHQCTNGAAYSLLTHSCSLPRDSDQCTKKQYSCTKLGDAGVWTANSSYYYVCQTEGLGDSAIYYPLMMKCPNGHVFNGRSCVAPNRIRSLLTHKKEHICQNGLSFPSDNPNAYFSCLEGDLVFQTCPLGLYFDAAEKTCVKDMQICQDGELYPAKNKYGFNYCHLGKINYQRCPIKYYFDSKSNSCRRVEDNCMEIITSPAENLNGFYTCVKGKLHYESCPGVFFYDENRDICSDPSKSI